MKMARSVLLVTCGAIAGIAFVLSCSDNAPGKVDAATCDCPAAEPPITADRYQVVDVEQPIPANDTSGQSAGCPAGTLFVSGSCEAKDEQPHDLVLQQSGFSFDQNRKLVGWHCEFKNNETFPITIKASVLCLKPAP
jgi:hypothetical protein